MPRRLDPYQVSVALQALTAANAWHKKHKDTGRGVELIVKIDGLTQLHRNVDLIFKLLSNWDYYFDIIEQDHYETLKGVFAAEGAYDGRPPWKKLSKGYGAAKSILFPGKKILEKSGRLKRSFIMKGAPGNVHYRDETSLVMGSNLTTPNKDYVLGELHSKGFTRPPIVPVKAQALRWTGPTGAPMFARKVRAVKVPPRPILAMSTRQRDRWAKAAHVAFMDQWNSKYFK